MWQGLYEELRSSRFTIIAVALDTEGAARPWIEAASPSYPALIDHEHRVAELYNFVNVPQATWIDEGGLIVRPSETAGAYEAFRFRDHETNATPEDELEKKANAQRLYLDAIRDWVVEGAGSRFVMKPEMAREHLKQPTPEIALAHAHFRLGAHLLAEGRTEEAERLMADASRLHPDSWAMWRQAAKKNELGLAADESFWQRVRALGERRYYPPPPMEGMP